jgi:hypothetical protein
MMTMVDGDEEVVSSRPVPLLRHRTGGMFPRGGAKGMSTDFRDFSALVRLMTTLRHSLDHGSWSGHRNSLLIQLQSPYGA